MKLKDGFHLRDVCGEKVLMAEGLENIDYSKIIHLNETAQYLWSNLEGKEFELEDMVDLLCKEYEVESQVAFEDCQELLKNWKKAELIEG